MDKNKLLAELQAANAKIKELEQKLKNCISIDAHLEWKREWEQQLKKAEEVIGFYGDVNNWSCSHSVVFTDIIQDSEWLKRTDEHGNNNVDWEAGGKLARQYLKSRGE